MTSSTARKAEIYVSSGQVLSGTSFINTDIFVEQGGMIADDGLHADAQAAGLTVASGGTLERASVAVLEQHGADSLLIAAGDKPSVRQDDTD